MMEIYQNIYIYQKLQKLQKIFLKLLILILTFN
jgi:hypothetical protein